MSIANTNQVGGTHYGPGDTYQHWDYVIDCLSNRYLEGQVTKYLFRYADKGGLQDIAKARHYMQKLVEAYALGRVEPMPTTHPAVLQLYAVAFEAPNMQKKHNALSNETVRLVFSRMMVWQSARDLALLDDLLARIEDQALDNA